MFPWAQFFLYVLVTAGTPGPNTLSSMSNGSRLGFRRTLPYIFGIWAGFSIVSTACTLLCSTLDALIPAIRKPMLVLGACYILYLAWKTWRAGAVSDTAAVKASFRDGFFLQFVINAAIHRQNIVTDHGHVVVHVILQTVHLTFQTGDPQHTQQSNSAGNDGNKDRKILFHGVTVPFWTKNNSSCSLIIPFFYGKGKIS